MSGGIVVAVDGSPGSRKAFRAALDAARLRGAGLTVLAVAEVRDFPALMGEALSRGRERELKQVLARHAREARAKGIPVKTVLRRGHPVDQILRHAKAARPFLLVLGSRGLSPGQRLLLGSVSHGVVSHAPCPVQVVR